MAEQTENNDLAEQFKGIAEALQQNEAKINEELLAAQGAPVDIDGYFWADEEKSTAAMRPSATLNEIIG